VRRPSSGSRRPWRANPEASPTQGRAHPRRLGDDHRKQDGWAHVEPRRCHDAGVPAR
jgi:hypothetical protein